MAAVVSTVDKPYYVWVTTMQATLWAALFVADNH